jgi:hypothetical protein
MRLIPIDWFYIGLSKDYGVTFKTDLAVGLYGISINPTTPSFFDVSPALYVLKKFGDKLPNTGARCLYILVYPTQHPPPPPSTGTPLIQRWISERNKPIRYIRHDPKRRFFNHVADNRRSFAQRRIISGNPYISGVATTKSTPK